MKTNKNELKQKKQRGRRKSKRNVEYFLRFLGVNAAGLGSKVMTLKKVLFELKPAVFWHERQRCSRSPLGGRLATT